MPDQRSRDDYDYERWARVKSLFADALRVPPAEREAWVRRVADDSVIENNVLKLLAHHHTADLEDESSPDLPAPPPSFDSSTVLAERFQIVRLIGVGGMGEVYEARDNHTGDTLAIKALRPELAGDRAFGARFLRELLVSRRIAHPNVCRVLEFYPCGNAHDQHAAFFTMEMLNGETLARRIARCGRMTPAEALPILRQIAAGLAEVHMLSIIHRDLKPANIMLVPDEIRGLRAVVMDFGLARTSQSDTLSTRTGPFLGTPIYMAPEQFKRGPLTMACDVYSFGITIVEMLTGRSHPLAALSAAVPQLKPGWNDVLQRCLDPLPENRPACVLDIVNQLEKAEFGGSRLRVRPKPWMIAAAAVLCIGACVAPVWMYANRRVIPTGLATKLTFENLALDPAASADGKMLVYASDRWQPGRMPGVLNIWAQSLVTGERHAVTSDDANEEQPAISPDGKLVAYRSTNDDCIYVTPVAGGTRRMLVPWGRNPQFSPDGKWIAYWTGQFRDYLTGRLYVVATAGGTPRQLAADLFDARLPVWSKSGLILFRGIRSDGPNPRDRLDWWITNPTDQVATPTGLISRTQLLGLVPTDDVVAWDSSEVIFPARAGSGINLWRAKLDSSSGRADSEPERLTRGGERETTPVLIGNGAVAYSIWHANAHVWRVSTNTGTAGQVTTGDLVDVRPSVSMDGRYLVFSVRNGLRYDVCRADLRIGGSCQQSFLGDSPGVLSPDGKTVALLVSQHLKLRSVADHSMRDLACPGCTGIAGWTPDENVVLRASGVAHATLLEVADLRSSAFRTLTSAVGLHDAAISPDGRGLTYAVAEHGEVSRIYIQSLSGSAPTATPLALTPDGLWSHSPVWSADGKQIYYCSTHDGFPCIWRQPIDARSLRPTGPRHELCRFTSGAVSPQLMASSDFALVRGGDWLYLSIGSLTGNVWTMKID